MNNTSSSFWQLLSESKINVPLYQRDYVQGRDATHVTMIRKDFVRELVEALVDNKSKELHFIFGGKENGSFVPVDGQQRLTTLFLLHWYVFARVGITDDEKKILKKFSYASRNTSKRFCEKIIEALSGNAISGFDIVYPSVYIRDTSWFTGNLEKDTTIDSMLVVLDEFHSVFSDEKYALVDFVTLKKCLLEDDCSITFLYLDMGNMLGSNDAVRDLYIKMNARGKLLTDFENFKAYLKKRTSPGAYDIVGEHLKTNPCVKNSTELLGRFNNEYTDFFFQIIDDGEIYDNSGDEIASSPNEQLFDRAMMNYFRECVLTEYAVFLHEKGIPSNKINFGDNFFKMSGKEFYHFITNHASIHDVSAKEYYNKISPDDNEIDKALLAGFNKAVGILEVLYRAQKSDLDIGLDKYTGYELILRLKEDKLKDVHNIAARNAFFEYVYRFKEFNSERFRAYMSFLWRFKENVESEHQYNIYDYIQVFRNILDNIDENDDSEMSFWKAIKNSTYRNSNNAIGYHMYEECIKADLLCKDMSVWKNRFIVAEQVHPKRQLRYLLDLSRDNNGDYREDLFDNARQMMYDVFVEKEKALIIKQQDKRKDFENILLLRSALPVNEGEPICHLYSVKGGSLLTFSYQDYYPILSYRGMTARAYDTLIKLLKEILNNKISGSDYWDTITDICDKATDSVRKSNFNDWRLMFVDQDMYKFSLPSITTKHTAIAFVNKGIRIYKDGKQTHASSADLYSAYIYLRLASTRTDIKLVIANRRDENIVANGIPWRYLEVGANKVWFYDGKYKVCRNVDPLAIDEYDNVDDTISSL